MRSLIVFLSLLALANAQFGGFFDQMFGGGGGGEQQGQARNNPSDASHYRSRHDQCAYSLCLCCVRQEIWKTIIC